MATLRRAVARRGREHVAGRHLGLLATELGLRLRAPRRLSERARWLAMRVGGFWHRGTNDGEAVAALVA
eukprot:scaffold49220_cov57-Phaeocystis_antarctica.AAC.2